MEWQDFCFLGAGHARHPRVTDDLSLSLSAPQSGSLWMTVLGGCYKCFDNLPRTCRFTADDSGSYMSVLNCPLQLLVTPIAKQRWPRG